MIGAYCPRTIRGSVGLARRQRRPHVRWHQEVKSIIYAAESRCGIQPRGWSIVGQHLKCGDMGTKLVQPIQGHGEQLAAYPVPLCARVHRQMVNEPHCPVRSQGSDEHGGRQPVTGPRLPSPTDWQWQRPRKPRCRFIDQAQSAQQSELFTHSLALPAGGVAIGSLEHPSQRVGIRRQSKRAQVSCLCVPRPVRDCVPPGPAGASSRGFVRALPRASVLYRYGVARKERRCLQ